jgi:hypothetical protein
MSKSTSAIFLDRIMNFAQRERRKTVIVALSSFMAMALVCHFIFQGPSLATAAPRPYVSDNLAGRGAAIPEILPANAMDQWLKEPKQPAKRNLFALNLEEYPADSSSNPNGTNRLSQDQKDQPLWDDVAKSLATQADQRRERELRVKNLQRSAAKLSLQKIIVGPPAKAMVNGEVIDEGGSIASFRVVKIESDRITVEKDGITLDVVMH